MSPPRKKPGPRKQTSLVKQDTPAEETVEKKVIPPVEVEGFVSEAKFDAFASQMTDALAGIAKSFEGYTGRFDDNKVRAVVQETINQGETINLGEVGNMIVESVTDNDHYPKEQLELDAFMEELVHIRISDPRNDWDYDIFPISVNGTHQPMIAGCEQKVRRKYIEVMARAILSDHRQKKPEKPVMDADIVHQMVVKNKPMYEFIVMNDSDRGRVWLDAILHERNK